MKRILFKQSLTVGIMVAIMVFVTPAIVGAIVTPEDPVVEPAPTTQEPTLEVKPEPKRVVRQEARREEIKTRLADTKLKVCKQREKSISNIMMRSSDRGTKQLATFTKISDRVQAFYKEKGLVLDNYEALVGDVNSKKVAAELTIANTKANIPTFSCDGTDPKGVATSFKESVRLQNDSLKEFKTAIKNLIVAVKSVNQQNETLKGDQ